MNKISDRLYSWIPVEEIEPKALNQLYSMAKMDSIIPNWVAVMPDCHMGKGACVGSVIPTQGAIIPAAVGVDIGCGVIAVKTGFNSHCLPENLNELREKIENKIPLGAGGKYSMTKGSAESRAKQLAKTAPDYVYDAHKDWALQLGTLGSGNHFIELCIDENDMVWVVLHSGSRGVGNQLALRHIKVAKELMDTFKIRLEEKDLAYLPEGTKEFDAYIYDLLWAQDYARLNREEMMDQVLHALSELWFGEAGHESEIEAERINCFSGDTEFLTKTGVVKFKDVVGTNQEVLTEGGQWVDAPIKSFGKQKLVKLTLARFGVMKEVFTTSEHRWLLVSKSRSGKKLSGTREEALTKDLKVGEILKFQFPQTVTNTLVPEGIARGFIFGDGTTRGKNKSCALFCGHKLDELKKFFDEKKIRHYPYFSVLNGFPKEYKTEMPSFDSSKDLIYSWLSGYFAADGTVDKTGRPYLSSASLDTLKLTKDLCTYIGIGTLPISSYFRKGYGDGSNIYKLPFIRTTLSEDFFLISFHKERFEANKKVFDRPSWKVVSVEETNRLEEVFCAVVPTTHSFTLTDNILTGNCHHNFTQRENHFGKNLWITRKGAIQMKEGQKGVIPGSMGTQTFVVSGLGNKLSYESAPHGAGRAMSRTAAKEKFTMADLEKAMEGKSFRHSTALIDEIPSAYKNIQRVMENSSELVKIEHTLEQVLNVKGD